MQAHSLPHSIMNIMQLNSKLASLHPHSARRIVLAVSVSSVHKAAWPKMHADSRHSLLAILLAAQYCLCLGSSAASLRSETGSSSLVVDPLAPRSKAYAGSNRTASAYIHMELLLRQVVAECAKGQDTVLQLDSTGQLQVLPHLPTDAPCAALDIALRGSERGVGMCTDVALYLLHMGNTGEPGRGARILPLLAAADMAAYSAKCTQKTARWFMESMYHEWLAPTGTGGYNLMQVNSEHMFTVHEPLHQQMDVFLCKTQFCQQLVAQYVTQHGWQAEVWFMGHTSSDVLVSAAAIDSSSSSGAAASFSTHAVGDDSPEQQQDAAAVDARLAAAVSPIHADYSQFLHVKGKSGLKHTAQLLECWAQHPEFPMLTVIGQSSVKDDNIQKVLSGSVRNIQLLPKPAEDAAAAAAVRDMARRLALAAAAVAAPPPAAAAESDKPAPAPTAGAAAKLVAASGAQPPSQAAAGSTPAPAASKPVTKPHQFGRKRQKVQQPAQPEQLQPAAPAAKEAAPKQQQQQQQPATQRPKQLAKQFGRRRKQPASQLPVQQSWQEPATIQETTPESAELQESKQKVLDMFSTLGLNTEPIAAATRRLLSSSSAFARQLLGSSSSSTAATGADSEKAAVQLAGKHLGWMPPVLDQQQLLSFDDTRQMQASSGVQICVSERGGFGHYMNEARAAGALVVSTDHPPMNELVQDGISGLLVKPFRTGSHTDWQALGRFSHLNAFLTPSDICAAMQRVLGMPLEQRQQLGRQARQQYLQDKAQFVKKLRVLRRMLHRRRMEGAYVQPGQTVTVEE